jgi:hypothetical protein
LLSFKLQFMSLLPKTIPWKPWADIFKLWSSKCKASFWAPTPDSQNKNSW